MDGQKSLHIQGKALHEKWRPEATNGEEKLSGNKRCRKGTKAIVNSIRRECWRGEEEEEGEENRKKKSLKFIKMVTEIICDYILKANVVEIPGMLNVKEKRR